MRTADEPSADLPSTDPGRHDPYEALRLPDFRKLLISSFLSTFGGQMARVALGWYLYERTHNPLALGLVGLVEVIPVILLSLHAGHLTDTRPPRPITLVTRAILGLSSVVLAVIALHDGPLWAIYAAVMAIGVARAFGNPANSMLLPQVVPQRIFPNSVTWSSNAWQLAAATGPAAGGLLIARTQSAALVFWLDAGFSVVYIAMVASMRTRFHAAPPEQKHEDSWQSVLAGLRFLRQNRLILATITLDLFAVLLGGAVSLLPVYAKDVLHRGPVALGWLNAMPAIGAVLMAFFLAHMPPMQRAGHTLLLAVGGFGLATVVFGLSTFYPLSLAMLFLLGALDNVSVVIRSTLLLTHVPHAMRGRISAVNSIFVGSSNELGMFESGVTAKLFGPVLAVVIGGVGTLIVVVLTGLFWPELRRLTTLHAPDELL